MATASALSSGFFKSRQAAFSLWSSASPRPNTASSMNKAAFRAAKPGILLVSSVFLRLLPWGALPRPFRPSPDCLPPPDRPPRFSPSPLSRRPKRPLPLKFFPEDLPEGFPLGLPRTCPEGLPPGFWVNVLRGFLPDGLSEEDGVSFMALPWAQMADFASQNMGSCTKPARPSSILARQYRPS